MYAGGVGGRGRTSDVEWAPYSHLSVDRMRISRTWSLSYLKALCLSLVDSGVVVRGQHCRISSFNFFIVPIIWIREKCYRGVVKSVGG